MPFDRSHYDFLLVRFVVTMSLIRTVSEICILICENENGLIT